MPNIQAVVPKPHFTSSLLPSTKLLVLSFRNFQYLSFDKLWELFHELRGFLPEPPTQLIPTTKPLPQWPVPFSLSTWLDTFEIWNKFHCDTEENRGHNLSYYSNRIFSHTFN